MRGTSGRRSGAANLVVARAHRGQYGPMNERARLGLLGLALIGSVAALSSAMVGDGPRHTARSSSDIAQPGHAAPLVPVTAERPSVPANFWTDYVQVDAVDGNSLRVHSTRHPDVTPPYTIVTGIPATPLRPRFDAEIVDALLRICWWDWDHATLAERLDDFRRLPVRDFCLKYDLR